MNKASLFAFSFVFALVIPSFAAAQDHTGLTRAQVLGELVELQSAGYSNPGADDHMNYPAQLQAAEARVTTRDNGSNYARVPRTDSAISVQAAK